MIALIFSVSVVLMIILPVIFALILRRYSWTSWLLFGFGCLTFVVSQVVHIPLNNWLARIGMLPGAIYSGQPLWQTALTLGLTAGLCEELARAAGYAVLRRVRSGWMRLQDSIMLGLGHGGLESMAFGGVQTAAAISVLLPLIGIDLTALGLNPSQQEALRSQINAITGNPWIGGLPLLERIIAISAHVVFSVMVWKAFSGKGFLRSWFYLPLAIVYHAAIDFAAVYSSQYLAQKPLLMEFLFFGLLIPGYVWLFLQIRGHKKEPPSREASEGASPWSRYASELAVYWVATKKEWRQLWKTRRLLVVIAIFLIFGMTSPLLAKLTPEIIRSVAGGETIASLIPTPTAADGIDQYVKNMAQFGFILAILLGMGAVVGEKERRVAPMILSKPMPRWAFIASKFTAQFLMYLVGFCLAGAGAFYYSWILFGPLDAGSFILMNGLLLLWLLTFVALSLLGSTLAKSTASGGGIGFLLAIVLMLFGSIPQYGTLLPGGLLGWATQAGHLAAGVSQNLPGAASFSIGQMQAYGGAGASALGLILITLILSIGFFEEQEL